jgi:hypothetical protein
VIARDPLYVFEVASLPYFCERLQDAVPTRAAERNDVVVLSSF